MIVRNLWLTGFDALSLHTLYVDKPMRGHTLMQAIVRVNRVFESKPGRLVVDYIGLGQELKEALQEFTSGEGRATEAADMEDAWRVLREKLMIEQAEELSREWTGRTDEA